MIYSNLKKIWFFIFIINVSSLNSSDQPLQLYTFYTPSHAVLKDNFFLPSIKDSSKELKVIIDYHDQECTSGGFMEEGWNLTMLRKVELIVRAIQENWGKIFVYADIDIQFFKPIAPIIFEIMDYQDILIQRDSPSGIICAGFFICKGNEKTLSLWNTVKQEMIKNPEMDDQRLLNELIREKNTYNIEWDYLPETFFSGGTLTGRRWKPYQMLPVPHDIVLHHANWTVGIENKIKQLKYVYEIVNN